VYSAVMSDEICGNNTKKAWSWNEDKKSPNYFCSDFCGAVIGVYLICLCSWNVVNWYMKRIIFLKQKYIHELWEGQATLGNGNQPLEEDCRVARTLLTRHVLVGFTHTAHFIVVRHKISLVVLFIQLVLFCSDALNCLFCVILLIFVPYTRRLSQHKNHALCKISTVILKKVESL